MARYGSWDILKVPVEWWDITGDRDKSGWVDRDVVPFPTTALEEGPAFTPSVARRIAAVHVGFAPEDFVGSGTSGPLDDAIAASFVHRAALREYGGFVTEDFACAGGALDDALATLSVRQSPVIRFTLSLSDDFAGVFAAGEQMVPTTRPGFGSKPSGFFAPEDFTTTGALLDDVLALTSRFVCARVLPSFTLEDFATAATPFDDAPLALIRRSAGVRLTLAVPIDFTMVAAPLDDVIGFSRPTSETATTRPVFISDYYPGVGGALDDSLPIALRWIARARLLPLLAFEDAPGVKPPAPAINPLLSLGGYEDRADYYGYFDGVERIEWELGGAIYPPASTWGVKPQTSAPMVRPRFDNRDDYYGYFDRPFDEVEAGAAWELSGDTYSSRVSFAEFERKLITAQRDVEKREGFRHMAQTFGAEMRERAKMMRMVRTTVTIAGVTYVLWRLALFL